MEKADLDIWHMSRALELAAAGEGAVEPNPMVGCVIARGAETIAEGWHRHFGGPHAEVDALEMAGSRARGATLYVTLEPCCHQGKTPPCTKAIIDAGIGRVVVAMQDPFPQVDGDGIARLRQAGVEVELGVLQAEARWSYAPYLKLNETGRPWVIAKWAMTLDGKIATAGGDSRWISDPDSRKIVHALRGRMDAIIIGRQTAAHDDPMLTARPPGPRVALRIVVDTLGSLPSENRLLTTTGEAPLLVAVGEEAPAEQRERLAAAGGEVLVCAGETHAARLDWLLKELGRRRLTNVLVEGGGGLLGSFLDTRSIDEVHAFIAPKLAGGAEAVTPIAGIGVDEMSAALELDSPEIEQVGSDVYLYGRVKRKVE